MAGPLKKDRYFFAASLIEPAGMILHNAKKIFNINGWESCKVSCYMFSGINYIMMNVAMVGVPNKNSSAEFMVLILDGNSEHEQV